MVQQSMSWVMATILDADWSTRLRTACRRPTLAGHPKLAFQLSIHRFVACTYRFLAGKQGGEAALSPGSWPQNRVRPFDPAQLQNVARSHRSNSFKPLPPQPWQPQRISASYHTAPARCPCKRTRHATRDKGRDESALRAARDDMWCSQQP